MIRINVLKSKIKTYKERAEEMRSLQQRWFFQKWIDWLKSWFNELTDSLKSIQVNWNYILFLLALVVGVYLLEKMVSFTQEIVAFLPDYSTYSWWVLGGLAFVGLALLLVKNGVEGSKRLRWPVALLLIAVVGYGVVRYFATPTHTNVSSPVTETAIEFSALMRPEQPVEGVMPPEWQMDWWGDETQFDSHVEWRDRDKVRIFNVKKGVEEAEIRIRIYPCTANASC
jgi:hypothetical protein